MFLSLSHDFTMKKPAQIDPAHLARVALFPLPNAVLFPSTILPLHIFEPRYRAMTREMLDKGLPIVVCKLREPRQLNAHGFPEFCEIGGVGTIRDHQELPDGRYNILLEGIHRVKILREFHEDTGKLYRTGQAEIVHEVNDPHGATNALISTLRNCIVGLEQEYATLSNALSKILNEIQHPAALTDTIASLIISDAELRQRMLEEPQVERRLDEVITRLAALLGTSQNASPHQDPWLN